MTFWNSFSQGIGYGMLNRMMFGGGFCGFPMFNFSFFSPCCFNSCFQTPMFFTPLYSGGGVRYFEPQVSVPQLPIQQISTEPKFDFSNNYSFNFDFKVPDNAFSNVDTFTRTTTNNKTGVTSAPAESTTATSAAAFTTGSIARMNYVTTGTGSGKTTSSSTGTVPATFDRMLDELLKDEGGFVDDKDDKGGATNKGITQNTYNAWRIKQGKPKQSVEFIGQDEVREIYYNEYYVASGADKISDPQMAYLVFDIAVHCGVGAAETMYKNSGGDINKITSLRKNHYESIMAQDKTQEKYRNGWMNRADDTLAFAKTLTAVV